MPLIQCESREDALQSVATVYGVTPDDLEHILRDFAAKKPAMLSEAVEAALRKKAVLDGVVYFHLSRAVQGRATYQEEGLIASVDRKAKIWELVKSLLPVGFDTAIWARFYDYMETSEEHWPHIYQLKTRRRHMSGPYGYMIRDVIHNDTEHSIHYFGRPETLRDITRCFEQFSDFPLQDAYIKATTPCIVKFRTDDQRTDRLETALEYLLASHTGGEPYQDNCVFWSEDSRPIPPADVLGVEWLPDIYSGSSITL